jgi:hypothetical protein
MGEFAGPHCVPIGGAMENTDSNELDQYFWPLKDYEEGNLTHGEAQSYMADICRAYPDKRDRLLARLFRHPAFADSALDIWKWCRRPEDLTTDVYHIRRNSRLQPGVTLILEGRYSDVRLWWKGAGDCEATFIDFLECGPEVMPAAFVELAADVDFTEQPSDLHHRGRYALLKLLYVADWEESGDVELHIVEGRPADAEAFFSCRSVDMAIEPNAQYRIVRSVNKS